MGKAAHIVLVGIPGSGKTITGRVLSRALRWPLCDLDEQICEREGMSVAEIFAARGEEYFRALEREATQELAQMAKPMVVAPGGGWMAVPGLPELLRPPAQLIWLRVSPQTALERMGEGVGTRPMLAGPSPLGVLTAIAAAREPFYLQADHAVSVELMTPFEAADAILALAQP